MSYEEIGLAAALLIGFFSSGHCLAMCGGIAGSLSVGAPVRGSVYTVFFSAGRILSYALAGALVAAVGASFGAAVKSMPLLAGLPRILTGVVLLGVGVQLAFGWQGMRRLERIGVPVWRRIAPLTRRLLPVQSAGAAIALGMLWGWLPCGVVYSMLFAAAGAGDAARGAALMAAFGAGTAPALIAAGVAAQFLSRLAAKPMLRRSGGVMLAAFGLWTLGAVVLPHLPAGHDAHAHHEVSVLDSTDRIGRAG